MDFAGIPPAEGLGFASSGDYKFRVPGAFVFSMVEGLWDLGLLGCYSI